MNKELNTRILIIDDDENIRDSFREILLKKNAGNEALSSAGAKLFGGPQTARPKTESIFEFCLDEACNGTEGFELVQKSIKENQPYSVIFVDMRMPGWDGLQTVQEIRKIDTRAEIIFVTAFSDHSIDEIVAEAGSNVGYHCKPFEVDEIRQLATKSVYEWNKTRNLEALISSVSSLKTSQWNTDTLLLNILHQIAELLGAMSAMLLIKEEEHFQKVLAIGELVSSEASADLIAKMPESLDSENPVHNGYIYLKLEKYGVVVLFDQPRNEPRQEHIFLVELFLEHAGQALVNAQLHEKVVRQEHLSAIGQAVSMISHDLRNPIGNIISCTEYLAQENKEGTSSDALNLIALSAEDALNMVEDLLDYVRGAEPKMVANDSVKFIEKLGELMEYLRKRFPAITLRIQPPEAFTFDGDTSKMLRVIDNLIRNAAEALDAAGTPDPQVEVTLSQDQGTTVFTVSDNGPGIPDKIRKDLFDPFKTFGKEKGTGLGLSIAKQFVESHHGAIHFESVPGKTVFRITL
jgi:two-component system NtrC family sensor kinase